MLKAEKLERRRAYGMKWREKHRDRLAEYFRQYAKDHAQTIQLYQAEYFQAHKRARTRRVGRDPEKKRGKDQRYRERHRERLNAAIEASKKAKPDLYKAHAVQSALRRRVRKQGAPVERVSRRRIDKRDGGRCHLCLEPIVDRPTFDHLIPVVRGGAHAEWNLMLAHDRCNKRRGTKPILNPETKEQAERYIRLRTLGFIDYPERGTMKAQPVLFLEG